LGNRPKNDRCRPAIEVKSNPRNYPPRSCAINGTKERLSD